MADNRVIREVLDWRPRVSFEDGIRQVMRWFRDEGAIRQMYRARLRGAG